MSPSPFWFWSDPALEARAQQTVSVDTAWDLVMHFATLVRESGSEDERRAAEYIVGRLADWGIEHRLHEPVLLISLPRRAALEVGRGRRPVRAKTTSFSRPTNGWFEAEAVFVPAPESGPPGSPWTPALEEAVDVAGKVAVVRGLANPGRVEDLTRLGAVGVVFVNPGDRIHEMIVTPVWGSPDLDSIERKPRVPVLSVNRVDGETLIAEASSGPVPVRVWAEVDEGWRPIPVIEAVIPGSERPEEFLLVHGHLDSWHVGVGDNATGDGALLELARVLHLNRQYLRRTVRVAWWSGHSHGRYAGSTWYADAFGLDLYNNAVGHVNVDSPGCRWATRYDRVSMMAEASDFVCKAVRDVTGLEARPERPPRAGDCSFNNIGLTTFFMLSSHMPDELRKEKGYYPVGGCGGNIEWHTEADTLEIADRENLERDIRVYLTAILRAVNAPIHPYNFARVAEDFRQTLQRYEQAAGGRFDFTPVRSELDRFERAMAAFNRRLDEASGQSDGVPEKANRILRRLGRTLIPINFTRTGRFRHDPARPVPPLPDLSPAERLGRLPPDSDLARVVETHLVRGSNRVRWALQEARDLVEDL
jgi:N-acetylated-alpha-linked acidic dipeptidase